MRTCLLALSLAAAPAWAESQPRTTATIAVAPAGECAGEERELAQHLLPKGAEEADAVPAATGPSALSHLAPTQVAAAAPAATVPLPALPAFAGPGACDNPGSGCATERIVDDPDPGSGCGFPGSPCP